MSRGQDARAPRDFRATRQLRSRDCVFWRVMVWDKDGKPTKKEAVLRKVTSWSPNKFFKVVAQSQELSK